MKWNKKISLAIMAAMISTIAVMATNAGATPNATKACTAPTFTQVKAPRLSNGNYALGTDRSITVRYRNCRVAGADLVFFVFAPKAGYAGRYFVNRILPARNQTKKMRIDYIGASSDDNGSVYRIHAVLWDLACTNEFVNPSDEGYAEGDFPDGCGPTTWRAADSITVEKTG